MSEDCIPKWKVRNWFEELLWLMNDKPFAAPKTTVFRIKQMLEELESIPKQENKDSQGDIGK